MKGLKKMCQGYNPVSLKEIQKRNALVSDFTSGGDFNKFTVIKNDDLKKYINQDDVLDLEIILEEIGNRREDEGKSRHNTYLVINTDEPYAPEIIEIIKRNGHWG